MPSVNSLKDLLIDQLKDIYSAEKQLVKALPKMAKAAANPDLKQGFTDHLEETKQHVARLEDIFTQLEASSRGKTCKAMEGLVEEGAEAIELDGPPGVRDAALIAAAQRVEHYEIASYGTVRALAEKLGEDDIAETLQTTLDEEGATDEKLTEIAATVNDEASVAVGAEEEEND
jgi:ferritin-like metal-binding protein YciE